MPFEPAGCTLSVPGPTTAWEQSWGQSGTAVGTGERSGFYGRGQPQVSNDCEASVHACWPRDAGLVIVLGCVISSAKFISQKLVGVSHGVPGPKTLGFVPAELSFTLLDSITDKDPVVQEQVCSALCSLGESQPGETLRACEEYLRQHDKVPLSLVMVRSSGSIFISQ